MALIPTSTAIVQSFAGALYGKQIGTVTMAAVNRDIDNLGLNNTLNAYFSYSFGKETATQVATRVVTNLGITEGKDNAIAYVVGVLGGKAANVWGQTISDILAAFSSMTADATYGAAATAWNSKVEAAAAYTGAADVAVGSVVSTFTLTTGINELTGTSGGDLFDATETAAGAATFTNLDKLDGGAGTDTLKIVQAGAVNTTTVVGATVANIENINITSGAGVTANTTTWTGATALTIAAANNVTATAAATTDVSIAASALTGAAGNEIAVNGGKNVTVTAADTSAIGTASANDISVGATTAAAGAVKVTYTETVADGTDTGIAGGTVSVTGGTTVEVNSLAVAGAGSNATDILTLGQVTVNGNASTTAVTVKQSAATAAYNGTTQKNIKITNGAVTIADGNAATAADTIKTVTLENFGLATITSTVLDTLNLKGGSASGTASGDLDLIKSAADTSTAATTLTVNSSGGFIGKLGVAGTSTMANAYTAVNIASAADTTFADAGLAANKALTVSGAGKTTFTAFTAANNAAITSIVSSGGGLTIGTELATNVAVTGGAGVENVMIGATTKVIDLGDGNDVVTVSTTTMGAGGSVKGGAGTDTLVANTNGSAFAGLPAFSGFETLRVAGAAAQGSHNAVGFTALEIGATVGATTFTNVAAGVGLTSLAAATGLTTVTLADATGTADVFNLTLKSTGAQNLSATGISIAGVETINITNTDSDTTAHTNLLKLTADSVKSLIVTGNAGLDLSGSVYAKVTNFDASGISGASTDAAALAVTYVSGNTTVGEVVSIKGGSGNDSLTGSSTANDTINGGAGADTLVYTGGADVFTGGAGADIFDINAVGTSTAYLTVTDAAVGDKLDFVGISTGTIANATLGAKISLGAAATLAQYLDAAAGFDGSLNATVKWFQFGSDTYVVVSNDDGSTGFTSGTDLVVKLTGTIDLSTSALASEVLTLA